MKPHILAPLFAALICASTTQAENPNPPRPEGPAAERLKHRVEELRRAGKHEEAERLTRHAREMWEKHRGSSQGEHRAEPNRGGPPANPGERSGHLAEAARHLRAAGIHVSPEQLERLGHRSPGRTEQRRPSPPDARAPGVTRRPVNPPMDRPAPGGPSPIDQMRNELRDLGRQVRELRGMVQNQRGGHPQPKAGEHQRDRAHAGEHKDHSPAPPAAREHRDGPARPSSTNRPEGPDRPRGDVRPPNPPGNPPAGERPRGDGPVPPRPPQ